METVNKRAQDLSKDGSHETNRGSMERYRENLPSKCFMEHKGGLPGPTSLDSRRWRFVRTGQDDFRRGCPPCEGLAALGPREGFLPQIYHRAPPPALKKRHAALCSKLSPAQQARKAFLAAIEAQLTLHPLALYPDLEEDLSTELLLKVLEVLDPDKKLEDTWAYCQGIRKRMKKPTKLFKKHSTQVYLGLPKKTPVSHPCQWLYEKRKPNETGLLQKDGEKPGSHLHGSLDIDEEFILRQFDINYQSKPCCNVLHTMRPSQVPLELKKRSELNKLQEPQLFQKLDCEQRLRKPQKPHKPKWVKMRYGAWYLNPKLWKKQRADEPLVDPKVLHKAQDENFKKELQKQEELLADLHGAVAFKDFILSRGYRMPSFLEKMYMKKECKRECNQRESYKITQA
ncbi:protein FAM47E [Bubalus kerabau]|uniref:protein FAM47E n=1 Tax=Bubalus carabanensis TaxID=3119969 RepID=UPI00244EBF28|nr:protein FAM47E [Bubalus carabanensis]